MAQVTWNAIVEQLGRPDRRWPKHEGHLQYRDRFKLCAFLVANEVPCGLIRKLAHTNQITLRDKKARYEWDRLAVLLCNNEEKRLSGTHEDLGIGVGNLCELGRAKIGHGCESQPNAASIPYI